MVIDDSPTVRKIIEVCLRREGYEVKTFPDGIVAISWLNRLQTPPPGLIFVDLRLPKLDGIEVIQHLKAKPAFEQTTFIMISCRDGILDRIKGRLAGAKVYLTKPVKTHELISVAQIYLGEPIAGQPERKAPT